MKFYFAPLEGINGYVYRNVYFELFHGTDKYFTPFISPKKERVISPKEMKDIDPKHNCNMNTVPQILTNKSDYFIRTADQLKGLGYDEVNLNLGCPSRTVVTKCKGAGFLADTERLQKFLEEIFNKSTIKISVKTRLGMSEAEEFYALLDIFDQYPLEELIIHPRTQADFYGNQPNHAMFREAVRLSRHMLCYNGDIVFKEDYQKILNGFPQVSAVMIGRGLLRNPALVNELKGEHSINKEKLLTFHNRLLQEYKVILFGEKTVLFKMKELWSYMIQMFTEPEHYMKKIKKTERICDYEEIIRALFCEQMLIGEEKTNGVHAV